MRFIENQSSQPEPPENELVRAINERVVARRNERRRHRVRVAVFGTTTAALLAIAYNMDEPKPVESPTTSTSSPARLPSTVALPAHR